MNSIDQMLGQQSAPSAPPPSATPAEGNSIDALLSGGTSAPRVEAPRLPNPENQSDNSIDAILGRSAVSGESPSESPTWYGKTWDWLNKPLFDFHREGAGGFESGVEDVLSGLTSPLSIGLTVGTLGSGTALRALGIGAKELPVAIQGLKALTEAGFTLQQAHAVIQESPRVLDALKEGDYETAKRLGVHVLANGALAGLGASKAIPEFGELAERAGLRPAEKLGALREELGNYQLDLERAGHGADALMRAARKQIGHDPIKLGAVSRYIEAGGDTEKLAQRQAALESSQAVEDNYSAKDRRALIAKYEAAQNLTPEEKAFADRVRLSLADDLERAYQKGVIRTAVENYISHIWEDDPSNPATNRIRFQNGSRQFDTNLAAAKARTFDSMFDGEMLGKKVRSDDPVALLSNYRYSLDKAIAARDFMERLQDKGLRMPDGRAIVAPAGNGETITGENGSAVFVNPKAIRSTGIAQKLIDQMTASGELQKHIGNGTIREIPPSGPDAPPRYVWETGDYRAIDHPAFRDWNFATNAPDETPVFVKSDLRVHPDAAEFLQRAVGADRSSIRDLRIGDVEVGKKFLKTSAEGKHLLLSLSPFHLIQEGLRAVMTGINPFGKLDFDLNNDAALQYGVTHGLTLSGSRRSLDSFTEGVASHSSIINKIPGLRTLQGEMQHFLFDRYIPGLKARAFKSLFERYQKTYSDISTSEAAQLAAAHSNELFGGLNYAQMGRSMATQDFLRATTLAPDWLESEIRSLARTLDPKRGAIMRQDIARISALMFGAARVLNMLTTGQPHPEAPFGVVLPGKKGEPDKVFTLRTLPTDMLHALTNPREFIAGRVNPLTVRPAMEFLSGRDTQGRKITLGREAQDFAGNFVPIPATTIAGRFVGDVSNPETVAKTLGASVYSYRTSAEKLAMELASDRMPTGPVSDEQIAKHQRNIRLEDSLRNGNLTPAQVRAQLPRSEAQSIIDNANLTPLQARFKRLPLREKLQVWDMALPSEKESLQNELARARQAYTRSRKPSQRAADPNWHRLTEIFGR